MNVDGIALSEISEEKIYIIPRVLDHKMHVERLLTDPSN